MNQDHKLPKHNPDMKKLLLLLCLLGAWASAQAQTTFVKTYGALNVLEEARRIIRTPLGKYLVVGYTEQSASDIKRDGLVFEVDASGAIQWSKRYGGSDNWEEFYDVAYVGGHYYCVGYTRTYVTSSTSSNVLADVFLVKMTTSGSVVWAKSLGNPLVNSVGTNGNDVGLRIIGAGFGGVLVVARINSGAGTDQNNAVIWVGADATTRWAYEYGVPGSTSSNELTYGICRDGVRTYVIGGWMNNFGYGGTSINGSLLIKINQEGDLLWARHTVGSVSTFASQYFGYYNNKNGKVYTSDYYTGTGILRNPQIYTNFASDGAVPSSGGGTPQGKVFHYGGSDQYRAYIFPEGDGYEGMILAANDLNLPDSSTIRFSTVIATTENLDFSWSKKVGVDSVGYASSIYDMITCEGEAGDLLMVGTASHHRGDKNVLMVRTDVGTSDACDKPDAINNTSLTLSSSALTFEQADLGSDWANPDTIGSISVSDVTLSEVSRCETTDSRAILESRAGGDYIEALECTGPQCPANLSFNFAKQPKDVYFEITDLAEDFAPVRSSGNTQKLMAGYRFADMGLKKGEYLWKIYAVFDDKVGAERKFGRFSVSD